jgi:hypothetical protein
MHQRPDQGRLFDGLVGRRQRFAGAPGRISVSHQSGAWSKTVDRFAAARVFSVYPHSVRRIERFDAKRTLAGGDSFAI